jgi:hypothetical protein
LLTGLQAPYRRQYFEICSLASSSQARSIGNFYLQVLAPARSQRPLSNLYFLDSHGQIPRLIHNSDYEPIKRSQIDWFVNTSQAQRSERQKDNNDNRFHLSLAFLHIPLPEFGDRKLSIRNGHRREPTEGPSFNSTSTLLWVPGFSRDCGSINTLYTDRYARSAFLYRYRGSKPDNKD